MNLNEKLSLLQTAAMEEARAEGNMIMKKHEEALQYVFEQHRTEANRQSELRLKAEQTSAKQQLNMAVSKAQMELKREFGKTQKALKKELFREVKEKLEAYMLTEEYKRLLVKYIEKAAAFAPGEEMTIYIDPSDEDKKTYLEEHTGMTLTVSKEEFIGGVRAVIPGRNILIDHAFKGAIDREYHSFLFRGGAGSE